MDEKVGLDLLSMKVPAAECPYCKEVFDLEFGDMERHIAQKHPEKFRDYVGHWL